MTAMRKDADNLKILETLRPEFDKLRTERIRNEDAIERHARDYETAKANAEQVLGTSDEAEIRAKIESIRTENTKAVDDFAASLRDVQERLEALERGPVA